MTKQQMEALAQRQLDAYNKRDLEAFCACYHPDVKVTNLLANEVSLEGMDRFREVYRSLFSSNPTLNCQLKSRIVLDEEWVVGIPRFPNGLHAVAIYGFRDGLIDRIWFPR